MSEYFESKLKEKSKEKSGLSSTMRNKLLQAYSKDKKLLKRMTSRHVEEETKGCDLASFTEAQELGEKELAHVDSIIENTKPEKMVDIDELRCERLPFASQSVRLELLQHGADMSQTQCD